MVTGYLIPSRVPLFSSLLFYFSLRFLFGLSQFFLEVSKVILYLFFSIYYQLREHVSSSLLRPIRALDRLKFSFENYTRASPVRSKSNERHTEAVPEQIPE